jgi:hypothetical protein
MKNGGTIRIHAGLKSVSPHAAAGLLSHAPLSVQLPPAPRAQPDLPPFLPNRFQGRLSSQVITTPVST